MSSAPARTQPPIGRVLTGAVWLIVLTVLAVAAAGLIGQAWHVPGSAARAELTYVGDTALDHRLDVAADELRRISDDVEQLASEAKTALAEVTSTEPTRLHEALDRGGEIAAKIDSEALDLREALTGLPGDGPNAVLEYSNATLVRRAAILAAIDAAASLASQWTQVKARSADAAQLRALIATHDETVLAAAAKGVSAAYAEAAAILDGALLTAADIKALRVRLIAGSERTVLDEWVERNQAYDLALKALYVTLVASNGEITVAVQSARREERLAFEQLPPDRRTILVIVAEVARGGLTQAVLAIEEANGRIDAALAEAG